MWQSKLKKIYNWYRGRKYLKTLLAMSKKNGFTDLNDYIDRSNEYMAQRAMAKLFQDCALSLDSGKILEVGAGAGRFTREIMKYVPRNVEVISLEVDASKVNFLKKYIQAKKWPNAVILRGDYFNFDFKDESFEMIIIPWFIQLSLYQWARALEIGKRILKPGGYFVFDFIDAKDDLIEKISNINNAAHYLINGNDVEKIAGHFSFKKNIEFDLQFNTLRTKYYVYQKISG